MTKYEWIINGEVSGPIEYGEYSSLVDNGPRFPCPVCGNTCDNTDITVVSAKAISVFCKACDYCFDHNEMMPKMYI